MVTSHVGDAFTHAVWKANDKLVSCAAGIDGLFHRVHALTCRFRKAMLAVGYSVVATLTMIGAGRSVCYCITVFYLAVYLAPINRRLFWSRCRRFASTNCLKCARLG